MKNKNYFIAITAIFTLFLSSCGQQPETTSETETTTEAKLEDGTYEVDAQNSVVTWKGEMIGMYSHEGTIIMDGGAVFVENGQVTGGKFSVNMTSINPTDDNYNDAEGRSRAKLVEHLSSDDFFATAIHQTSTYYISEVSGNKAAGQLTVRGKSGQEEVRNLVFEVQPDGSLVGSGQLIFNRQNYDVAFKHPLQEMVLSDNIELNIKLIARKSI
jgi:polyisoprenoid-binding protein YceI